MKKSILIILSIIAAFVIIAVSAYLKSVISPVPAQFPEQAELLTPQSIEPGDEAAVKFYAVLPLDEKIVSCSIQGKNITAGNINAEFDKLGFDTVKWKFSGTFRTIGEGKTADARIRVETNSIFTDRKNSFTVALPEINCFLPENFPGNGNLHLATEYLPQKKSFFEHHPSAKWFTAAAIIMLMCAAVTAFFIRRKRKKEECMPLDRKTILNIKEICSKVHNGKITAEKGFSELCDVVRIYLEARFSLPVTRRTTVEFLQELAAGNILHGSHEKIFITEFLNTADMIKFAGMQSDKNGLDNAAAEAENLVVSTTVTEEKK